MRQSKHLIVIVDTAGDTDDVIEQIVPKDLRVRLILLI